MDELDLTPLEYILNITVNYSKCSRDGVDPEVIESEIYKLITGLIDLKQREVYIASYHDGMGEGWMGKDVYKDFSSCEDALLKKGFVKDDRGYKKIDKEFWDEWANIEVMTLHC